MSTKIVGWLSILLTVSVPANSQDPATPTIDTFIVKFKPSHPVRRRKIGFAEEWYLNKTFLPQGDTAGLLAKHDLDQFTATLSALGTSSASRLFPNDDETYDQHRINAESNMPLLIQQKSIGQYTPVPDLNLFYLVVIQYKSGFGRREFLDSLSCDNAVETAYPLYHSIDASFPRSRRMVAGRPAARLDKDYTGLQAYLYEQPTGINARSTWMFPGGQGDGIHLIDIEFNWNCQHADLKPFWLCPNITYGLISVSIRHILSVAIAEAADMLHPGDVILIEQELQPDSLTPGRSACGNSQYGVLPAEAAADCYQAIADATTKGIIVVEAAGNGELDLDDPQFLGRFNPQRSPGAIMVAADTGGNVVPACYTNYGSRVNYYAWGDNVVTTGGVGDLTPATSNRDHFYTNTFNGTSSASPIIAGVIADIQGIRHRRGLPLWHVGDFLQNIKGSPQAPGTANKPIGIFPDLSATLSGMF